MPSPEQQLHQDLEAAVQKFLLAQRAQLNATLDRAFGTAARTLAGPRQSSGRKSNAPKLNKRRTADEFAALSERRYQVIVDNAGQGMVVLSQYMGVSPLHLQPAVARLRAAERIRTVGARQHTRYFPRA